MAKKKALKSRGNKIYLATEPCPNREGEVCGQLWRIAYARGAKVVKTTCVHGHRLRGKFIKPANPDMLKTWLREHSQRRRG